MKAWSYRIKTLWPMLKFFKNRSGVQNLWYRREGLVIRYINAKYESPISYNKKVMANVKVFTKVGEKSQWRSQVQNLWYRWKGLIIRITHAKYERLIFKSKKVMVNVKVFWRTDRRTDRQTDGRTDRVITIGDPPLVFTKVGQKSQWRSQVQNLWYRWKGLIIRITHAKYERLISKSNKVMVNVKVWRTDGQSDYYRAPAKWRVPNNYVIMNLIIILAKKHIYRQRLKKRNQD